MREQLERSLAQPVEIYTARDFHALTDDVQRNESDMTLLPAHLARVAVADWGWAPLTRTVTATPVLVLVHDTGPVRTAADLRGGRVGMLCMLSLVAGVGARWLADQRLAGADGAQVVTLPSINSALMALERGALSGLVLRTQSRLSPKFRTRVGHGGSGKTKGLATGVATPSISWLPDLGSNQGPTD